MSDPILATNISVPASSLGGPGAPDPEACAARAIAALTQAVGADMRITSISMDVASHQMGEGMVEIATRIDKRAKSIVFASSEARVGASMVFSAQGLFSRVR